jgi:hypothetical protein
MMSNSRFFAAAGTVLALCTLVLTGCPPESSKTEPDPRLVNTWENGDKNELQGLYKKFTIDGDYKFTASINPIHTTAYYRAYNGAIAGGKEAAEEAGEQALANLGKNNQDDTNTRWTVTGRLVMDEGNKYFMKELAETTNKPSPDSGSTQGSADTIVKGMDNRLVKILFTGDDAFIFSPANSRDESTIGLFFGGGYRKAATP